MDLFKKAPAEDGKVAENLWAYKRCWLFKLGGGGPWYATEPGGVLLTAIEAKTLREARRFVDKRGKA